MSGTEPLSGGLALFLGDKTGEPPGPREEEKKPTQHSLSLFSENYDPYVHTKTFEIKAHNNSYEL